MAIVTNNHSNQPGTISSIKRALGAEIFHEPNQDIVAKLVKRDPELYSVEVPIPVVHRTQTTFEMVAVLMSYLPASVRDNEQDVWKIAETLELPDGGYELFDDQTLIWISANPFLINGLKTPNCAHALTSAAEQY